MNYICSLILQYPHEFPKCYVKPLSQLEKDFNLVRLLHPQLSEQRCLGYLEHLYRSKKHQF